MDKTALLIVDLQRDFCPGGALAVTAGDHIVPVVNRLIDRFVERGRPVIASRDWHPADHCSFAERGGRWRPHCIADTEGAMWHPDLALPAGALVIDKATASDREAYSAFEGTDLERRLREMDVEELWVVGLATDYCVQASVIDALEAGFDVRLVEDGIRGIDASPGDSARAIAHMYASGARSVRAPAV